MLSIVPSPPNVVPLRAGGEGAGDTVRTSWAGLSAGERNAFREIARALGARLEGLDDELTPEPLPVPPVPAAPPAPEPAPEAAAPAASDPGGIRRLLSEGERPVLDRLPLGVIAYRVSTGAGTPPPAVAETNIALPAGARVLSTAVSDGRLVVTIDMGGITEVRFYDVATLQPRGRLVFDGRK